MVVLDLNPLLVLFVSKWLEQQKTNRHCSCLFQTNPEGRCPCSDTESPSSLLVLDSVPACFVYVVNPADVGSRRQAHSGFQAGSSRNYWLLDLLHLHYKYLSVEPTLALSF